MKRKKEQSGLKRRPLTALAEIFQVPVVTAGESRLTLSGSDRLLIENHRGLAAYGPAEIAVECASFRVRVGGSRLGLVAMTRHELVIGGCIRSIMLEAGRGRRL